MARGEHRPSCAKTWRIRAESENWPSWETVQAIHRCCGVSLLKAHRLERGWTAGVAVQELQDLCRLHHFEPPKANVDLLNSWENGRSRPRPETLDLLARLYKSNAIRLGFVADYGEIADGGSVMPEARPISGLVSRPMPGAPDSRPVPVGRVQPMGLFYRGLHGGEPETAELLAEVERLRQDMDRVLATATVTEDQMDRLDEAVLRYRTEYLRVPPLPMLCQLMLEFTDVHTLMSQRQPGPVQRRLSYLASVLAVLSADALMKLGDLRQSRAWYGTAKTAADDTGDPWLRTLVRAQEAMLPYYYGDPGETVRLAVEAQGIARTVSGSPTALAAAAEGRARARLGDHKGAEVALARARSIFGKLNPPSKVKRAFDFTEERLYLYLSGAHAYLPFPDQAADVQKRALELCNQSGTPSIDPALINLDRATSLAMQRDEGNACELVEQTILALPPEHRTSIVFVRARDVRRALGPERQTRALRSLDETLRLEAGN
ncbi:helix-turn-helix domain-containing protein [Spirillospora sp. CA-294931]|uniref:helix-turn-helix domain-containing protein n=1 Tax=Spirillospora sp. CA-294931 TaxID=3240042 RepID=UPI003D8F8CF1